MVVAAQLNQFAGFEYPESNYTSMPNGLIGILPIVETLAELKVVLYILRHTWGYREFDEGKRISLDEFEHGRKRRDGTRIDNGIGMVKNSIIDGLDRAVEHGFIVVDIDDSDKARVEKFYALQMFKVCTPEYQSLHPVAPNFEHRSEKETIERNLRKDSFPPRLTPGSDRPISESDDHGSAITAEGEAAPTPHSKPDQANDKSQPEADDQQTIQAPPPIAVGSPRCFVANCKGEATYSAHGHSFCHMHARIVASLPPDYDPETYTPSPDSGVPLKERYFEANRLYRQAEVQIRAYYNKTSESPDDAIDRALDNLQWVWQQYSEADDKVGLEAHLQVTINRHTIPPVADSDLDPNDALDERAEIVEGQRQPPAVPIRGIEAVRRSALMMTPDEVRALPAFDVDLANAVVSAQEQRNEMLAEEGYSDLPVPRSWQVGDRVSWKWQPRGGYGPAYLPAGVVIGLTRQQIKILVYESAKSEFQEKTVKAESLLPRENESQPLDAESKRRIAAAGKAKKPALAKAYSNKDVYNAFAEVFFGAADDVEAKAVGGRVGPMREQLVKHVLDKRKESDLSEDAIAVLCAHIRAFGAWWDKNKIDKKTGVPLTRPQHWNSLSPAWLEYCKSPEAQAIGKPIVAMKPCPTCHGQAVIYSGNTGTPCRDCGGKGKVQA